MSLSDEVRDALVLSVEETPNDRVRDTQRRCVTYVMAAFSLSDRDVLGPYDDRPDFYAPLHSAFARHDADTLARECPRCFAPPNTYCVTASGSLSPDPHRGRVKG